MKNVIRIWFFLFVFLSFWSINLALANRNLSGVEIISREERWADESIRFLSKSKTELAQENALKEQQRMENLKNTNYKAYQSELKKKEQAEANAKIEKQKSTARNSYMNRYYPNDWSYDKIEDKLEDHFLLYGDHFHYNKTKIVVHHTAMDYDPDRTEEQIKQHLQLIYKYHTIDRDFWDIGYNFLIDGKGNIYEGRHGWAWSVGMHVSYNNIATIGISLMGNFEKVQPTQAQIDALTDLITALAQYYHIDPMGKAEYFQPKDESPYIYSKTLWTIVGHGDIAPTACPGKNVKILLPSIREEVAKRLFERWELKEIKKEEKSDWISSSTKTPKQIKDFWKKLQNLVRYYPDLLAEVIKESRTEFDKTFSPATNLTEKIAYHYSPSEIKSMMDDKISVLLYELTTKYQDFTLTCDQNCIIHTDQWEEETEEVHVFFKNATITYTTKENPHLTTTSTLTVLPHGDLITIQNYGRKSYLWIPWNTFRGEISFTLGSYIDKQQKEIQAPLVINTLDFQDYLKGIVESNDTETLEKNKVMAMISKAYALFYLKGENAHPSIPNHAEFQAIDDPDFFQKYAWAGVEKTLTKWQQALKATENEIVLYEKTLPLLPYFSCSQGFTLSAKEKFGWTDTPYLTNVVDFWGCSTFKGHGVWLAWQGAEYLAKQGMTYDEILQYFYPWVELSTLE